MSSEVKQASPPSDRSRARKKKPATREELLRHTEQDQKGPEELVRYVDQLRHGEDTYGSRSLNTVEFFTERRAKTEHGAFRRILDREGGEPPRSGDELP